MATPRQAAKAKDAVVRAATADGGEKLRFLLVGIWNTLFAYGVLWVLDGFLHDHVHYVLILTLNWIISVTQNLFTYKILVFRTHGGWLKEYARSYVVQIGSYLMTLGIVTIIMQLWHPRLVIATLPAMIIVVAGSYLGYKYFAFRGPRPRT